MFLLDTNILSELMQPKANKILVDWVNNLPVRDLYISSITQAEIEFGVEIMPSGKRKEKKKEAAKAIISLFSNRILPFDDKSASHFAAIKSQRQTIGRPISFADAQIAAIALQYKFVLATRNTRDFKEIHGLQVVNPWEQ